MNPIQRYSYIRNSSTINWFFSERRIIESELDIFFTGKNVTQMTLSLRQNMKTKKYSKNEGLFNAGLNRKATTQK